MKELGRSAEVQESWHKNTKLVSLLDGFIGSHTTLLGSLWNEGIVLLQIVPSDSMEQLPVVRS